MVRFGNKRSRPEQIDWIQENFKDSKLRVLLYLQYGLNRFNIPEQSKREVLSKFESSFNKIGTINTVTKAALMLKQGLIECGYDPPDKAITSVYNLAGNVLSYRKILA